MVLNWIFKRLVTPDRVKYLIENNQGAITEAMKSSIIEVLEDEEIATGVIAYTDQVYNRYLGKGGKLWSTIGGVQKGINSTINQEGQQLNPFSGLLTESGDISLAGLVKGFLSNTIGGTRQGTPPNTPNGRVSGRVPRM